MGKLSVSIAVGNPKPKNAERKCSLEHSNRIELTAKAEKRLTEHNEEHLKNNIKRENIIYCQDDIKKIYEELFGKAVKEYDEQQKRNYLKIGSAENYLKKIKDGNQEKEYYEAVIQFGDKYNAGIGTDGEHEVIKMLDEYVTSFQKRNPNLRMFNAVMHLDEATPHVHLAFVPFIENTGKGLPVKNSLSMVLHRQGCFGIKGFERWIKKEKDIMTDILNRHNCELENKFTTHEHMSVENYGNKKDYEREYNRIQTEVITENAFLKSEIERLNKEKLIFEKETEKLKSEVKIEKEKNQSPLKIFNYKDDNLREYVEAELEREQIPYTEEPQGFSAPEWATELIRKHEKEYKKTGNTVSAIEKNNSKRDNLKIDIDKLIYQASDYEHFLELLKQIGEVKTEKYLAIKPLDGERFIRIKSLGEDYTEQKLKFRISKNSTYSEQIDERIETAQQKSETAVLILKSVKQYITLFNAGKLFPNKKNKDKVYSFANDKNVSELMKLNKSLNSNGVLTKSQLENIITEKAEEKNEKLELLKIEKAHCDYYINLKKKAEFYFNWVKDGCPKVNNMTAAKLSSAKETLEEFELLNVKNPHLMIENALLKTENNILELENEIKIAEQIEKDYSLHLKFYEKIEDGGYIFNLVQEELKRLENKEVEKTSLLSKKI